MSHIYWVYLKQLQRDSKNMVISDNDDKVYMWCLFESKWLLKATSSYVVCVEMY
jgi:hypothetical protein